MSEKKEVNTQKMNLLRTMSEKKEVDTHNLNMWRTMSVREEEVDIQN